MKLGFATIVVETPRNHPLGGKEVRITYLENPSRLASLRTRLIDSEAIVNPNGLQMPFGLYSGFSSQTEKSDDILQKDCISPEETNSIIIYLGGPKGRLWKNSFKKLIRPNKSGTSFNQTSSS